MKTGRDFFRWLTPGLLSLCLNLPLTLGGLPFGSFDAYTHIFFADHYRRAWFDLVEPKWFGGFSVVSYPPLVHQLIALISRPISAFASLWGGTPAEVRFGGEAAAYCVVLVVVLTCLPVAVERFARIFVPARAARAAAWLSVGLPSIYLTAYAFGQLPTLAATTALLWAIAEGWQFVHMGRARDLLSAVLWAGVTAALHHAVLLFALVLGAAIAGQLALEWIVPGRRSEGIKVRWARAALWAGGAAVIGALTVWPFIAWSKGYTPQAPIDHLSRHNVLAEWLAGYYFLWPMYGLILLVLPVMMWRAGLRIKRWFGYQSLIKSIREIPRRPFASFNKFRMLGAARFARNDRLSLNLRPIPLLGSATLLFVLGLGGTTPLPALLFGSNWEWLTYDRFSLWAGLALLPMAGLVWQLVRRTRWKYALPGAQIFFCLYGASASAWVMAQPPALDVTRIARWLDDNAQGGERYLTLGFGDQLAKLSMLTEARTIDGTYFTARQIPALRESGIGTIDGVKWSLNNVWEARPMLILSRVWGVRWVLNAWDEFDPVLRSSGYQLWGTVAPGVSLWRNSAAWVSTEFLMPVRSDPAAARWWGFAPTIIFLLASLITFLKYYGRYWLVVSVVALISLWPFWYNVTLWTKEYSGVYFTYTSGLLFLADLIAIGLVAGVVASIRPYKLISNTDKYIALAIAAILLFAILSIPASVDPALSLAFVAHVTAMIIVGWAAIQAASKISWRAVAIAFTLGLLVQSTFGLIEVAVQNTAWLESFGLIWPGVLNAETRGASVVGLASGLRWLRAYGTLPHPNMLGAYLVVCLAGPFLGYVKTGKARWLVPLLIGAATLFLTFSRAAWLAGAALLVCALVLLPAAFRRRVVVAGASVGAAVLALAVAFYPLVLTRLSASGDSTREVASTIERLGLAQVALDFIQTRPLNGVGVGTFTVAMAANAPLAEPVHNLPLLAASETGLGGGAAVVGLGGVLLLRAWRRRGTGVREAILAAGIISLIVISLFDHFLWSLSEGRLWAAGLMGLWLGTADSDDST